MFESLDEQMKQDEHKMISPKERVVRWLLYIAAGVVVLGGVLLGVRNLG
jgi:hypothetical protein